MTRPEPQVALFTKIAVTVPTEIYAVVEQMRRRLGKSRSSVVASALEGWIRSARRAEADRRYVEGYLRTPESVDEIAAVAAQATSHWSNWAPDAPSRAAGPGPTERRVAAQATSHWSNWAPGAPSRASEADPTEPWGLAPQSARRTREPGKPRAPRTPRSGARKQTRR